MSRAIIPDVTTVPEIVVETTEAIEIANQPTVVEEQPTQPPLWEDEYKGNIPFTRSN